MYEESPQMLEDRVQATAFMGKHGMKADIAGEGDVYGSGVYGCAACISQGQRCLIPLLSHLGNKRFRAHACIRCGEGGKVCSLDGTVMYETAGGGVHLEKPDAAATTKIVGKATLTRTSTSPTASPAGETLAPRSLTRMQRKIPGTRARSKSPFPSLNQEAPGPSRSPPLPLGLPTPQHSSPRVRSAPSSEGAVSSLMGGSPPESSSDLPSIMAGQKMAQPIIEPGPSLFETKNGSVLGPPPTPPHTLLQKMSAMGAFTSSGFSPASISGSSAFSLPSASTFTTKRRRTTLSLGPGLTTNIPTLPSAAEYAAAVASAKSEMRLAETHYESAFATFAEAKYAAQLAIEAEALVTAEETRLEEERAAALAHAEACRISLENMQSDVSAKKRARLETAAELQSAQVEATATQETLEITAQTYTRVVHGYIVKTE